MRGEYTMHLAVQDKARYMLPQEYGFSFKTDYCLDLRDKISGKSWIEKDIEVEKGKKDIHLFY